MDQRPRSSPRSCPRPNRVETLVGLLKSEHGLEDHGARSWWGLLTRISSLLTAYTLARYCDAFHLA